MNSTPLDTKQDYQNYVNSKSPNSPILKNCFNAFWVGGLICTTGQLISSYCQYKGLDQNMSNTIVSIIVIIISLFKYFFYCFSSKFCNFFWCSHSF